MTPYVTLLLLISPSFSVAVVKPVTSCAKGARGMKLRPHSHTDVGIIRKIYVIFIICVVCISDPVFLGISTIKNKFITDTWFYKYLKHCCVCICHKM